MMISRLKAMAGKVILIILEVYQVGNRVLFLRVNLEQTVQFIPQNASQGIVDPSVLHVQSDNTRPTIPLVNVWNVKTNHYSLSILK